MSAVAGTSRSVDDALPPTVTDIALKGVRTIMSVADASHFVNTAIANFAVGWAVGTLTISIEWPPVPPVIRSVLVLARYLTDLTLMLPAATPPAVLHNIKFPALQFFKTNLPHDILTSFLARHNSISILVLGPCGRHGRCSLADIDLKHVTDLDCEARCAKALVHGGLCHLAITGKRARGPRIPAIFRQLPVVSPGLYSLTASFFPDDHDILDAIRSFAPFLKKLKLVEQRGAVSRLGSPQRRAFKDPLVWGKALRKLPFLEEFALRTSADLVRLPGDHDLERRVIVGWAFGVRTRNSRIFCAPPAVKAHPTLYHIRILYGATRDTSALSKWFKDGALWRRLGQPVMGQDLDDLDF